jgi:hypothetical protein
MKRARFLWLFLTIALVLPILLINIAVAKGQPEKLVVSGTGLRGRVEVNDPQLILQLWDIADFGGVHGANALESPPHTNGYQIDAYDPGVFDTGAWERMVYYPNLSRSGGYVFYFGYLGVGDYKDEKKDKWFPATPWGDAAMRRLLARLGVRLATPSTLPATGEKIQSFGWLMVLGGAMFLLGCSLLKYTYDHRV